MHEKPNAMTNRKPLTDPVGEVRKLTQADFAEARPAVEVLPGLLGAENASELLRKRGRPTVETPKVFTAIRLDADIVAAFKTGGKGWQTRLNAALRDWLKTHPSA